MQVPGGWLSDRFGSKYVVIITIVMWSLFTAFTSLAWSLTSLIAIRFMFGIAEGGFPPASIRAVAEVFRRTAGRRCRRCCCRPTMPAA
ncbi:MFS family permease [Bradyrhizobium sp. GM7.3]